MQEIKIIYNTEVLKSSLSDYNDAYILVRGNITNAGNIAARVAFKNRAPFTKYITKVDRIKIDDAEDLVMPIYNLLEQSSNYPDTTVSLWFYSEDEGDDLGNSIINTNAFKSFKYTTKLIGSTAAANGILEDATAAAPLKYLSNFGRSLEILLIN